MRRLLTTNWVTKVTILLIITVICAKVNDLKSWEKPEKVISSDVKGYYGYLPAIFINDDLKFENETPYYLDGDMKVWLSQSPDGSKYIKFPTGMATLYSPFFAMGHYSALSCDEPANGYSEPYRFWLLMGSLFYTLLGLFFISRLLLRHFSDYVTATTLLILYLGTNLFYYSAYDGVLTHGYSFMLISGFMLGCVVWLEKRNWGSVILLGICGGLMIAVRQIDLIFLPFILLYGVRSIEDFKTRWGLLWQQRWMTLTGIILIFLMLLPQLLYHHYIFGAFFHYSYDEEGFFFLSPHFFDSMLSYRNGWLVYSPIMILAIVGLFFIRKNVPKISAYALFSFPIYYYVLASWWCWWFVGFGNRAYINLYPLLAFSIAAFFVFLYQKRWFYSLPIHLLILAAIGLNYFQSYQLHEGILHWDGMNKRYYWYAFGREEPTQLQRIYLEIPDIDAAKKGEDFLFKTKIKTLSVQHLNFEETELGDSLYGQYRVKSSAFEGKYRLLIPEKTAFTLHRELALPVATTHVLISAWVQGKGEKHIVITSNQPPEFYHLGSELNDKKGDWKQIQMLAELPKEHHFDSVQMYLWNEGLQPISIDAVEITYLNCVPVREKRK